MVRLNIYNVLVLNKNNYEEHQRAIEKLLKKLTEIGLKVNT